MDAATSIGFIQNDEGIKHREGGSVGASRWRLQPGGRLVTRERGNRASGRSIDKDRTIANSTRGADPGSENATLRYEAERIGRLHWLQELSRRGSGWRGRKRSSSY